MNDLNARLLAAHAADDRRALAELYEAAAKATDDEDAAGFFLTQAYVFALETGHAATGRLRAALVAAGRDTPDTL